MADTGGSDNSDITELASQLHELLQQHADTVDEAASKKSNLIDVQEQLKKAEGILSMYPGKFGGALIENIPFENRPGGTGARVPPDTVPDFRYFYQDNPDTGKFPVTVQQSNEKIQDKDIRKQMSDVLTKSLDASDKGDWTLAGQLMDQHAALAAQSILYRQLGRDAERINNTPIDANIIQQAADRYHSIMDNRRDK